MSGPETMENGGSPADRAALSPASALHLRAESRAAENAARSPQSPEAQSPEEMRRLLHELAVHQIELETQNSELCRVQQEMEAAQAHYLDLYDLAPVGYCTISEAGVVLKANIAAAGMFGVARGSLVGSPMTRLIFKEDQDKYYLQRKVLLETGKTRAFELRLAKTDGTPLWAQLGLSKARGADGAPELRVVLVDIHERTLAQDKSRMLMLAIEQTQLSVVITNVDSIIEYVNPYLLKLTGHPIDEVLGRNASVLQSDRTPPETYLNILETLARGDVWKGELDDKSKDGREFTEYAVISPLRLGGECVTHYVGVKEDITKSKARDKELTASLNRSRKLARALVTAEARERRQIAEELHDDLGQSLAFAKLKLSAFEVPGDGEQIDYYQRQLEGVGAMIDRSIRAVRSLATQLNPPGMSEFGLGTALQWLADDMRGNHGLSIRVDLGNMVPLEEVVSSTLFRIVRELLNNVCKHARVQEAELTVLVDEQTGQLEITVSDDGIGFDAEQLRKSAQDQIDGLHYGLYSVGQRVRLLGGVLRVDSQPGAGTIVTITLPMEAHESTSE